MILSNFYLETRANKKICDKYGVEHHYNSRGFRDREWPDNLDDAIWCFGDSTTVGNSGPLEYMWPNILEHKTGIRTINISMSGASNDWITRKVTELTSCVNPRAIILHWSYLHRREMNDNQLTDEQRRIDHDKYASRIDDTQNFIKNINLANTKHNNIVFSIIPNSGLFTYDAGNNYWNKIRGNGWPDFDDYIFKEERPNEKSILEDINHHLSIMFDEHVELFNIYKNNRLLIDQIIEVKRIDTARDGLHYGELTSTLFVDSILKILKV